MRHRFILSILCLMSLGAAAHAQGYAIDWFTIDGGGGTSGVGNSSLNGTIGQSDAGAMNSGAFNFSGGFWPGVTTAPALSIRLGVPNNGVTPSSW